MKKAHLFFVFASFLGVLLTFQNCSAPLQEEGEADSASGSTGGYSDGLQFAFDTSVDQIAYMTCHQLTGDYDRAAYFTLRVGAYNLNSGIKMTDRIVSQLNGVPLSNQKTLLRSSKVSTGARPLLSIRNPLDVQSTYFVNRATPTFGVDQAQFFATLSDDLVLDKLLRAPHTQLRYLRNGVNVEGLRVEGDLHLNNGVAGLNAAKKAMEEGLVAINYSVNSTTPALIRTPAQYYGSFSDPSLDNKAAYGKGLKLTFKRHPSAPASSPAWLINTVDQVDMELVNNPDPSLRQRAIQSNYMTCNDKLVFKVVEPKYLATSPCSTTPDNPSSLSSTDRELFRRARLSLRVEDWYIDWAKKCIVPKKSGQSTFQCYGAYSNNTSVEFDLTKECYESPAGGSGLKACASLVSICTR